jgi:hypothetical protein
MCWLISSKTPLTRRDEKFLEKCKDDAISKSIPIIDETDPKYFQYSEENLPIPTIQEEHKNREKRTYFKEIGIVEYISAMSKEHEQISKKQVIVVAQKKRKKKNFNKN